MKFSSRANVLRAGVLLFVFAGLGGWVLYKRMSERPERTHFSVEDRLRQYEPTAGERVKAYFDAAGVPYPPMKVELLGLKTERKLQVYATSGGGFRFVHEYPVMGASGFVGPKLKEGDSQVPEGIYKIDSLNPNSLYHLALRVGYPNDFDLEQARKEGRTELGGDIMIHGAMGSTGCLAMGDPASEDLFVLAARTGIENIRLVICPVDFRVRDLPSPMPAVPAWTGQLYASLRAELAALPVPRETR
jgi:hypothetical protein